MNTKDPLIEQLIRDIENQRKYASFFESSDKGMKELGVVKLFFEAMERSSGCPYVKPRIAKKDPPDIIAEDKKGNTVGLEVTELVDEGAVRLFEQGEGDYKVWEEQELLGKLEQILLKKDKSTYHGGPYSKLLLIIHTDETFLDPEKAIPLINKHVFPKTTRIHEAYLLFSYDPRPDKHPYLQLMTGSE